MSWKLSIHWILSPQHSQKLCLMWRMPFPVQALALRVGWALCLSPSTYSDAVSLQPYLWEAVSGMVGTTQRRRQDSLCMVLALCSMWASLKFRGKSEGCVSAFPGALTCSSIKHQWLTTMKSSALQFPLLFLKSWYSSSPCPHSSLAAARSRPGKRNFPIKKKKPEEKILVEKRKRKKKSRH